MEAAVATEGVWGGGALTNPANVEIRPWKTALATDQPDDVWMALRKGRDFLRPCLIRFADKSATAVQGLECLSHIGVGDEIIYRFHAWAPLSAEAKRDPTEHWRVLYDLEVTIVYSGKSKVIKGPVRVSAIFIAPDRVEHHSRPRPSLP